MVTLGFTSPLRCTSMLRFTFPRSSDWVSKLRSSISLSEKLLGKRKLTSRNLELSDLTSTVTVKFSFSTVAAPKPVMDLIIEIKSVGGPKVGIKINPQGLVGDWNGTA